MDQERIPRRHDLNENFDSRLELAIDGALNRTEEERFLTEIRENPECMKKYQQEKSYKEFISDKLTRKHVSPSLISQIKQRIKTSAPRDNT